MQIKTGKVTVTQGSSLVYANADADWLQVSPGSLFMVQGRPDIYYINAVSYNQSLTRWEITITPNYGNTTLSATDYLIVRDFTPNFDFPLLDTGDVETAKIYTRAMSMVDERLSDLQTTVGQSSGEVTYTQAGHNFVVGTAVYIKNNGGVSTEFALASGYDATRSRVVGIVSYVNGDTFRLRTSGTVTDIVTTPGSGRLTTGLVYYLTSDNNPAPFNVTSSEPGSGYKIPLYIARSTSTAQLFGATSPTTAVFVGANGSVGGLAGLVPAPVATDNVKFLKGDATWGVPGTPDASLLFRHLDQSGNFIDDDWTNPAGTKSIYKALLNLDSRLKSLLTQVVFGTGKSLKIDAEKIGMWVCPGGVGQIRVTLWGAGGPGQVGPTQTSRLGPGGGAGGYFRGIITTTSSHIYILQAGRPGVYGLQVGGSSYISDYTASNSAIVSCSGGYAPVDTQTGGVGGHVTLNSPGLIVAGYVLVAGENGQSVALGASLVGRGGNCYNGGAGGAAYTNNMGAIPGSGPGGGGSGGILPSPGGTTLGGGNGAGGFCLLEW